MSEETTVMEPEIMDEEIESSMTATAALVHQPVVGTLDLMRELVSPESLELQRALSAGYDKYCRALLSDNDVQVADGKEFKKKSAWRKLGRAFRVSTKVVDGRAWWEDDEDEGVRHLIAEYRVRATAPWGQYQEAVGVCSTRELRFYTSGPACPECGGPMWDNRNPGANAPEWKRKLPPFTCRDKGCKGKIADADINTEKRPNATARAKADHDVRSTAETRATNRAISNLIAAGEVSYEEVDQGDRGGSDERRQPAPDLGSRKKRYAAALREGGLNDTEATSVAAAAFLHEVFGAAVGRESEEQFAVLMDWLSHQMDLPPDYAAPELPPADNDKLRGWMNRKARRALLRAACGPDTTDEDGIAWAKDTLQEDPLEMAPGARLDTVRLYLYLGGHPVLEQATAKLGEGDPSLGVSKLWQQLGAADLVLASDPADLVAKLEGVVGDE